MDILLLKDEINWAFVHYDEGWHRKRNFDLVAGGGTPAEHMNFPEFRNRWLKDHVLSIDDNES